MALVGERAMTDDVRLIAARKSIEESVDFLTSVERRPERELWIANEFLTNLGLDFKANELQHVQNDPPDVRFRDAAFETKIILDHDRLLHAEYRAALAKANAATSSQELWETATPRDLSYAEATSLVEKEVERFAKKYAPSTRSNLDMLFYVNLVDVYDYVETPLPPPMRWEKYGFRSVALVMGALSGVLAMSSNAPAFLREFGVRIAARPQPY